ncbi:hypothetical protein OEZ86_002679 [Tetradesmus obliquus]|nr:hypothetical protein OEZ86_002679 [Tetradesmus obliquus]
MRKTTWQCSSNSSSGAGAPTAGASTPAGAAAAPAAPAAAAAVAAATPPEVLVAWKLLKEFTRMEIKGTAQQYLGSASGRAQLRDALMLVYSQPCVEEAWACEPPPDVLMGVVASDSRLGVRALRDWCEALGLPYLQPENRVQGAASIAAVQGAVYLKYNSRTQLCYISLYQGRDRGVLLQLGQGELLGHFPLGLFDEAMAKPAPSL